MKSLQSSVGSQCPLTWTMQGLPSNCCTDAGVTKLGQSVCQQGIEDPHLTPTSFDMDKVKTTIKQLYRDWSKAGKEERDACYLPVLSAVEKRFPPDTQWVPLKPEYTYLKLRDYYNMYGGIPLRWSNEDHQNDFFSTIIFSYRGTQVMKVSWVQLIGMGWNRHSH